MAKKNAIQIAKVKYKESEGRIFIGYTRKSDEFTDIRTSNSDEKAAPEFYEAMDALQAHAGSILGFTQKQIESLRPHTVTFSYDKKDRMSAVISCVYETPNGKKTNINTPLMQCPVEDVGDMGIQFFAEDTVKALWDLELQARKYLDGKRAQVALFGEESGETEDAPDGDEADEEATEPPVWDDMGEGEENIAAIASGQTGGVVVPMRG